MNEARWRRMAQLEESRTAYALATVVHTTPPSSARPGMRALVTPDGGLEGFVGGQCTRETVVDVAREVLRTGQPRIVRITADPVPAVEPGVMVRMMTCASGGEVTLFVEPHIPAPVLAVVGDTPIARAVVELAHGAGYDVRHHVWQAPMPLEAFLDQAVAGTPHDALWVVASQGAYDEDALLALAPLAPPYLGVVASPRRAQHLRAVLREAGASPAVLDAMVAPAGLDLGAVTPVEIAVTIVAQLMERRRERPRTAMADAGPAAAGTGFAVDPVCGMTVDIETSPHRWEYDGRSWVFCDRSCRDAFARDPMAYMESR